MKISKWLITNGIWLILILSAILRLWKLDSVPPGLTPDEASLGYNAYSFLKTGNDEYGKFMPIIFKSFGDFKPGLYVYATVPFVAALGLNEWAVRLPSALAGIVSVYLIYLIVEQMVNRQWLMVDSKRKLSINHQLLAILAAFVAAVNPWLIYFSRGAWEANLSLAFTLSGIYFFLKSLEKSKYLIFSSLSLSLTLLTYQGAKLSTLIVMLILVVVFWKEIISLFDSAKTQIIKAVFLGLIIALPVLFSFFNGQTGRLDVFSIFSYPRPQEYTQNFLSEGGEKINDLNYYLYHSESLNFARGIIGRWFNHFSGKFLFFDGDYQNPRHSAPNSGMLLLLDLLLLPLGLYFLVSSNNLDKRFKVFLLVWLILSPLPAILSRDEVQAVRALNMSIPLVIISSLGFYYLVLIISNFKLRKALYFILFTLYATSLIYFLENYFVHLPIHNAKYWQYGFKQAVEQITLIQSKYNEVIFQQSYSQPYIYFLFYQKYDPSKYQKLARLTDGGKDVGLVESLGNIKFMEFSWPPPIITDNTLVAGNSVAIPDFFGKERFNLVSDIKYPDQFTTAFRIVETK